MTFGVTFIRTTRGLLDATSVRIVEVNPIRFSSLEYSHLRLLFYPLPAARDILRKAGRDCSNIYRLGARLKTIRLDELLEFRQLEPKCAAHFHKWNPSLVHPAVESGCRDGKELSRILHCDESAFRSRFHLGLPLLW